MRGPWGKVALGAALAALFGGRWLALSTAERLWAAALGVGAAHADIALLRSALAIGAFAIALAWYGGNLLIVYRQIGAVQVPRQVGNLEIVEHVPRRYLLWGTLATAAILAVVSSHGAGDAWALRAVAKASAGNAAVDPILGRDLGYYLFRLPWERALHGFALQLAVVAFVLLALLYAAIGAIRRQERRLLFVPFARWHLAALSGTLALVVAWGYTLEPGLLVGGLEGVPYDTVLLDVRVPAALILVVVALGVAVCSLVWMRVDRARLPILGWTTLLGTSFVAHFIVPAAVAGARGPDLRRAPDLVVGAASALRAAFGLPGDTTAVPLAIPDEQFTRHHVRELDAAPLWDAFVLTEVLNRVARPAPPDPRSTGRFFEATLTLVPSEGRPVPVYLAVREPDSLAQSGASTRAVASVGGVAVRASGTGVGGLPLFVPDLAWPDSATPLPTDLDLRQSELWFTPTMSGDARVPADRGLVGVPVGGIGHRIALAWALQSPVLLSAEQVPSGTLVIAERAVGRRLARYAPFAQFGAAWPAILDGRLLWLAWGYVAADAYPLGTGVVWRGQRVRALHAGFVGTVDAATGVTRVYLAPGASPIGRAWRTTLPDLVLPTDMLPAALLGALRYPEEVFAAQLQILRARPGRARPAEPYWWAGPSVGDSTTRLRLRAVDEVQLEPRVAAILEGVVEDGTPRLRILRYPQPYTLAGPSALEQEFAPAAPSGAAVGGRLRLLPFADGAVGLQSFYADSGTFVGLVAGWGGAHGTGVTPREALARLSASTTVGETPPRASPLELAREWFRRLDRARAAGDWEAFGEAWTGLQDVLGLARDSAARRRAAAPPGRD